MHICFIANEFPLPGISFGGIGTFLVSYSKILIDKGHQVSIVGVVKSKETIFEKKERLTITYKPQSNVRGLAWFFNCKNISETIAEIHSQTPIDIVEAQEAGFAFIKIPKGIPKIIRMHGGHHFFASFENKKINKWKALQEKRSFKRCDAVISTSDFVKTQTKLYINFENKLQATINNPILMDQFYPADPMKVIKGLAVFAGTLCEKKGIRQLCMAIPEISAVVPDFHLYAYGRDWFFPNGNSYKDWLLSQLSEEIKAKITFKEPVTYQDLPKAYEEGEICVFPSHIEVQGLVAPEAMSMQKPVVFTKYGPGPETIDEGVNGWLCDTRDEHDIAKKVIQVFNSRALFDVIGKNARLKVELKFSPLVVFHKNYSFYEKLIMNKESF
jgi:glycosyltransferase involved in cell wall biosynthesis